VLSVFPRYERIATLSARSKSVPSLENQVRDSAQDAGTFITEEQVFES
jgi:hypothetical protein